jgi:RNA polymerase sigma factor (sigma-70 family)
VGASTSDEDLLSSCLGGRDGAWRALIERYAPLIYSIPLKYGLSEPDAADIFQAVCVTLFEKLDTIRDPRRLPAWLITTTTRASWAARKQASERSTVVVPDAADPAPLPEEELLALERRALLRMAIDQLPRTCRQMLRSLFDESEQPPSYDQLGRLLGLSSNSVGPTRARCLERLRTYLVASGYFG